MVFCSNCLLQSTIAADPSDWCINRFSMFAAQIRQLGEAFNPEFSLTAQDYLSDEFGILELHEQLRGCHYGQFWLMAPDLDNGPDSAFFEALEAAVASGTQLVIARDHTDLGCSMLAFGGCLASVAKTQTFNRIWPDLAPNHEYFNSLCLGIDTPCVGLVETAVCRYVASGLTMPCWPLTQANPSMR